MMYAPAYIEQQAAPGVWLLELTSIEMNVDAALRSDVIGVEALGAELPSAWDAWRGAADSTLPRSASADIPLKKPFRGKKRIRGLIAYSSLVSLIDFLFHAVAAEGDAPLAQTLRAAQNDGRPDKARLEELLFEPGQGGQRHFNYHGEHFTTHVPLVEREEIERRTAVFPWQGRTCRVFTRSTRFDWCPLMAVKTRQRLRRHVIPRVRYLLPAEDWRRSENLRGHEFSLLCFDGRDHAWRSSVLEVPARLLQAIEQRGRLYAGAAFDVLPQGHLRARAVVRLPSRKEAGDSLGRAEKAGRPPVSLLRRPGFLLPSLAPIRLPRSTPVVDDPRAALFVWLRTTRGIYLPDDRPRPSSLIRLRTQPAYLILAEPCSPL